MQVNNEIFQCVARKLITQSLTYDGETGIRRMMEGYEKEMRKKGDEVKEKEKEIRKRSDVVKVM